jgi:PqqD family protein of HPr-rel-A system
VLNPTREQGWLADPTVRLIWRKWGDAHFAFDPRSHQTHFLNTLAVEVVALLDERPKSLAEIHLALTERYEVDDDDDSLLEAIQSSLNVLDRLGIILSRRAA